jgi:PKD repeat protein
MVDVSQNQAAAGPTVDNPSPARFTLRQLAADPELGTATAKQQTRTLQDGSLLVSIEVRDAVDLKALFYELDYDAAAYTPLAAQFLNTLAPTDQLLSLSDFSRPGSLQHGAVIRQALEAEGFNGSGVLAELRFAARPFAEVRSASLAPRSIKSQATLNLDAASETLSWGFANEGDYDQNSEVNVADLAPLGTNFLESTGGAGSFPPGSKLFMIDGDQNGEINIADLSPIGTNFQRKAASYKVYRSLDSADIPVGENPSTIEPLGFVDLADSISPSVGAQRRFSFKLAALNSGWFYWVRPCDLAGGLGNEGIPSNVVSTGGKPDNVPPTASLSASPDSGDAPLTVSFDASGSSDSDGTIIQFAWDFNGDGLIDTTTTVPTVAGNFQNPGIFTARVLVTDDGAATASAQTTISVNEVGNEPPSAALGLDPSSGSTPLSVTLDASGSTDDGSIVNHEWDFDGDGSFDATTSSEAEAIHLYETAGSINPVVRVTDNFGLTDTASASLTLTQGLLPPVVLIEGETDFVSGDKFFNAAGSFDPDGTIVSFIWDLDADGFIEADMQDIPSLSLNIPPGLHELKLTVTDNDGLTATTSLTLRSRNFGSEHMPPFASFTVDPLVADSGVSRTLDASASAVGDGEDATLEFRWDFDGNFTDDEITTEPIVQHTYNASGMFRTRLTVRQLNSDASVDISETIVTVPVTGGVDLRPLARLTATPVVGIDPNIVNFDASASEDFDGTITKFEWDIDGDFSVDIDAGANPLLNHGFTSFGGTLVTLFVTDDDGLQDTASVEIFTSDPNNPPPAAVLVVNPENGNGPRSVTFNASASTDDEQIVSFQFDIDGDGQFDIFSDSGLLTIDNLNVGGTHTASVRVVDDDGGFAIATDTYAITGGFIQSIVEDNFTCEGRVALRVNGSGATSLANVFYYATTDKVHFTTSSDASGQLWNSPSLAFVGSSMRGRPSTRGVLLTHGAAFAQTNGIHFITSTNLSGDDWNDPIAVASRGQLSSAALVAASVNPAIAFIDAAPNPDQLKFMRSTSISGSVWPDTEVQVATSPRMSDVRAIQLAGFPAVFYTDNSEFSNLKVVRATAADGSTWGTPVEIPNSRHDDGYDVAIIDGRPAVSVGGFFEGPRFIRANDNEGATWGSSVAIDPDSGHLERSLLAEVNGRPCIFWINRSGRYLFARGNSSTGASFEAPQVLGFGKVFDFPEQMSAINNKALILVTTENGSRLVALAQE